MVLFIFFVNKSNRAVTPISNIKINFGFNKISKNEKCDFLPRCSPVGIIVLLVISENNRKATKKTPADIKTFLNLIMTPLI